MVSRAVNYEAWVAIDQTAAKRMARDPEIAPLWLRIMFAAIGWSNLIGHTNFAHGGLALVLQSSDPKTGELKIPSASQVANEIRTAKDKGLIGRTSDSTCLVAPDWWLKAGGTGGKSCQHHSIRAPRRATPRAQPFTQKVNEEAAEFTSKVKPLHPKGERLSVKRPISDSGLYPTTTEREATA